MTFNGSARLVTVFAVTLVTFVGGAAIAQVAYGACNENLIPGTQRASVCSVAGGTLFRAVVGFLPPLVVLVVGSLARPPALALVALAIASLALTGIVAASAAAS